MIDATIPYWQKCLHLNVLVFFVSAGGRFNGDRSTVCPLLIIMKTGKGLETASPQSYVDAYHTDCLQYKDYED